MKWRPDAILAFFEALEEGKLFLDDADNPKAPLTAEEAAKAKALEEDIDAQLTSHLARLAGCDSSAA